MRIQETKVFKFDELSDSAKEKAREWWRDLENQDSCYHETVIEDAATIADIIGIDLRTRPVKLMGGGTRYDPCVYWSGFWSQGDGACFEGRYRYVKGSVKKLQAHIGKESKGDIELMRIARGLAEIQRKHFYGIVMDCKHHQGHYYHSGCMEVTDVSDNEVSSVVFDEIEQLLRDFADWIYDQLQREYEWTMADAQVDETIRANEYEFEKDGSRA